jgi:hypothetical protein
MNRAAATMNKRVRPTGDYWHGHIPPGAVYVGRKTPNLPASPFANPFPAPRAGKPPKAATVDGETVQVRDRPHAIELYRRYIDRHPDLVQRARRELAHHDLACWCSLPAPGEPDVCHAAVLLEIINERPG